MDTRLKPKVISALLLGGTLVLVGGGVLAAVLPSSGGFSPRSHTASAAVRQDSAASTHKRASAATRSQAARSVPAAPVLSTVTYTVRSGETLSEVAEWFTTHGYGVLYSINEPVLRSDPNAIQRGERITIANGVMSLRGASGQDLGSAD